MRPRGVIVAIVPAVLALAVAAACTSSYGTSAPADAGTASDAVAPPPDASGTDAGADAFARTCPKADGAYCIDFDGPPNPVWNRERREGGGNVVVDPSFGNPGASLHASMPSADAGVAARSENEVSFPPKDSPLHLEVDVYLKKPATPLPGDGSFAFLASWWDPGAISLSVTSSNVDTAGTVHVIVDDNVTSTTLQPTARIPFDTWVHLVVEAQYSNSVGHVSVKGLDGTIDATTAAPSVPAQALILSLGISRYVGATPQLDVWYDNVVVTFP